VKQHASNRALILTFLLSLLIFSGIRWDITPWIEQRITQAARQAGYQLYYDSLHISGFTLTLEKVHIQKQQNSIMLDNLHIKPAWSLLITGTPGADIRAVWQGNPISTSLSRQDDMLTLSDIDAVIDANRLEPLKLPVKLSGIMHLQGHLSLQQSTGLPTTGKLNLTWQQAAAGLSQPEIALGDYTASISNTEGQKQPWQWQVSGGSSVALDGSGTLAPQGIAPNMWPISGLVDVRVDKSNPTLSMMMQGALGSDEAKVRISGSLGAPRTDMVR